MTETRFEIIFKEAYGYQLRAVVEEWDSDVEAWVASDISSFTTKQFKVEKPDGTSKTITADFETDGTDGVLIATVTSLLKLLNIVGYYKLQVLLSNASQYFPTSIVGFDVDDPL